ncbi:MAG: hypothetical protein EOM84_03875, partial [Sphingobacteriia bacterium]|nr:hypothetical protein [Sphingobacteriia bacterium]
NAWAGQLESYLNVTEKDVLEKVKKCWSSLFTARAIFYRFEKDLQLTKISVAVVVQKMINSEKSGIAFTVHPVTEDRNQMIIEAGYGLGEAIVSGSVTPDSYVISKEPYKIVDLNIGYQDKALFRSKEGENEWIDLSEEKAKSQVLSEEEIYKLGEIILEIENHYGFPCDIEWAFEKGNFYIVQSRPITTLKNKSAKGKIELEKVFSMDKSLMYMFMWNITDGAGFKKFINFEAKNTFFIFDSKIKKTYVWYDLTERKEISRILNNSISSDKYFSKKIIETLDKNWKIVSPFLAGKVEIKTKEEIKLYYEGITNWWSAMNTVYPLINAPSASKKELDLFLKYREKTEKYTGKMDELLMDFFIKNLPKHKDMVEYLTFTEAIDLIDKKNSRLISEVKKRKEGFFICHGIVYPQDKMEEILNKNNLLLKEKIEISENVIKGVVAFCGKTSGLVRKVIKKEDISNFKEGEILVAETTYPDHVPIMQKAAAFVT